MVWGLVGGVVYDIFPVPVPDIGPAGDVPVTIVVIWLFARIYEMMASVMASDRSFMFGEPWGWI